MKILWITNVMFPDVCRYMGISQPISGGWLFARAKQLAQINDITLSVATVYKGRHLIELEIENIHYYLLPVRRMDTYQKSLEQFWGDICRSFQPDIVHINGTEYPFGLACMRAYRDTKYVVSIQGLVSVIARYYFGGISVREILMTTNPVELLSGRSMFSGKRNMGKRGKYETECILRADLISGRTTWDLAHVRSISPQVQYHYCSRTLRDIFYESPKWSIEKKKRYSIFLSKGTSPFKGLHIAIKAAAILKAEYPEIIIRIAGKDMLKRSSWKDKLKFNGYQRYILKLVKELKLFNNIQFTGPLSEQQVAMELLDSHIFVCPSSIENSSNSIAEAQILGVPTVASDVGGNMDMVEHGISGFIYRFEEVELLAHYIKLIFDNDNIAIMLSAHAIKAAEMRHDRQNNLIADNEMYKMINNGDA